ncbi:hypothetical protein ACMU_10115 [Actibacterium mucosum KCTC 23349]|uniref:Thioredoxin domain-containing protein n=1 Tax=Actibacterium mucosum KCTC 23349 TaxID=1454373 RepID=A0A037ZKM3_9RHOB|nr:hypothetical protein ACMU_10115 [Actibacterium mucosum KCTC 23349]
MSFIRSAVLYTALALGANFVAAADIATLEAMREGSIKKLNFHSTPAEVPPAELLDMAEGIHSLDAFHGKYVVLNFWATWCAPCRKEMPGLEALQEELGGDDFDVVAIATGRNPVPAINKFFESIEVDDIVTLRDPKQQFARQMRVLGLPMTMILDREGREIARLQGDAEWDSESAKAILNTLIAGES